MKQSPVTAAVPPQSWAPVLPLIATAVVLLLAWLWFFSGSGGGTGARRAAAAAGGIAPLPSGSRPPSPSAKRSASGDVYSPATTLPVLGNLLDMLQHSDTFHDWVAELAQRADGRPVRLVVPGKPDLLVLSTPAQFEAVQKHLLDNFIKGPSFHDLLFDLLGDGIFAVNGDKWKRQRQILVRLFTARSMRDQITPIIRANTRTLVAIFDRTVDAPDDEGAASLDLFELMQHLTLDTFVEIAFGVQLGGLAATGQTQGTQHASKPEDHAFQRAFDEAQSLVAKRFVQLTAVWKLKRWLNVGSERRLREAMDVVNGVAYGLISKSITQRQQSQASGATARAPDDQKNLVDLLLDVADSEGIDVTPTHVRDMVVNALVAGRDTTAEAISWSFHLLHQHPRVVTALRDELRRAGLPIGSSQSEPYIPSMDDVHGLPYLEATMREAMRLHPSAGFTVKHCIKDSWLPSNDGSAGGGTFVPAGTDVGMSVFAMGRLPRVWGPDASQFRPERFLDETTGKLAPVSPFKFSAFSGGPRVCVGQALATLQVKLVLAAVLLRFDVSEVPGQDVTYTSGITLPMKNPLYVRVSRC